MPIADFIIAVFCLIDDELKKFLNGKRLRQRGPSPGLQDSEVMTMEIYSSKLNLQILTASKPRSSTIRKGLIFSNMGRAPGMNNNLPMKVRS